MKENEKINELSDEQLSDVSGGTTGIDIPLPEDMGYPPINNPVISVDLRLTDDHWVVIETGEGFNAHGKYRYKILYNASTGERRESRYYINET